MYEIGTVVITTGIYDGKNIHIKKGIIVDDNSAEYGIEFKDYIGGHNCNGKGRLGHCWYVAYDQVMRADKKTETRMKMHMQLLGEVL
jgi:hypothetical protein